MAGDGDAQAELTTTEQVAPMVIMILLAQL
jgi:hypothetical protein